MTALLSRGALLALLLAGAGACSSSSSSTDQVPASPPSAQASREPGAPLAPAKAAAAPAVAEPAGAAASPSQAATAADAALAAGPAASPQAPASEPQGHDFIADARMLYRAVACTGDQPVPAHLDQAVVAAYCKRLTPRIDEYRKRYVTQAREFIAKLRPANLPTVLVYPFGGGDLISALVAFPDATEITTMSLEHAGDPRRIRDLGAAELKTSLAALSVEIGGMLSVSSNTSKNMSDAHQNLLPAQLSSFLIALAAHGYEPTSVRYMTLQDDGSVRYLSEADIAAQEDERARQLKHDWTQPNFSPAFSHVELRFRRTGAGPNEPERIHRHFAVNLANSHLDKNPAILRHLEAKGKVSAMTKGASYLLWRGDFSKIRDYMLANLVWMISDSTGIPPQFAKKAGMKLTTLGRFEASFLEAPEKHNQEFRALWTSQPYRRLPFRFGYVDSKKQAHLLITEPAGAAAPPPAAAANP